MYLYNPVLYGFWRQHELWDGTYTINDLFDINEAIQAKNINEGKVIEHYKEKQKQQDEFDHFRGRR